MVVVICLIVVLGKVMAAETAGCVKKGFKVSATLLPPPPQKKTLRKPAWKYKCDREN